MGSRIRTVVSGAAGGAKTVWRQVNGRAKFARMKLELGSLAKAVEACAAMKLVGPEEPSIKGEEHLDGLTNVVPKSSTEDKL